MHETAAAELAPTGVLRAGINLANFLLVTGRTAAGDPQGVAPDMAAEIASRLGVEATYVPFEQPGDLADAATSDGWGIGLIGADPSRAEHITFSPAYVEIEATYLVRTDATFGSVEDVDKPGVRIAVSARSAYDLYLSRNLEHAELVRADGIDASCELFVTEQLDALAGLRPRLIDDVETLGDVRMLDGSFTAVQQAIGARRGNAAGAAFLETFVEEAKASGFVAELIERHNVRGLSVAPPA